VAQFIGGALYIPARLGLVNSGQNEAGRFGNAPPQPCAL